MITSFFGKEGGTKRTASKRAASKRTATKRASTSPTKQRRGATGKATAAGKASDDDAADDGRKREEDEVDEGGDGGDEVKSADAPGAGTLVTVPVGGIDIEVDATWAKLVRNHAKLPYFKALQRFVGAERKKYVTKTTVFPPAKEVFAAFNHTPKTSVRVVIIGQDPYHNHDQANGLCFSVRKGVKPPPSLRNIIKEVQADVGIADPKHGSLECWADQGVFLLNTVLTVQAHKANSHRKQGWEQFTDAVIAELNKLDGLVFMLWGKPAQKKGKIVSRQRHLVLESVHPSPLSAHRGFFGSKHFSKANAYLTKKGLAPIDWSIV